MTEIIGRSAGDGYAIIGTREPDEEQSVVATQLAFAIAVIGGQKVRTGAANGIDHQAMLGTGGKNLQVFLPWRSYNSNLIPPMADIVVYDPVIHGEWTRSVSLYHPAAKRLSRGAFALHARNFGIIYGARGVIALPGPGGEGGTGQGIRIAKALGIKVLQANKGTISDAPRWIGKALQELGFADPTLRPTIQSR